LPRFSQILKVLIEKGLDVLFESLPSKPKEEVSLPPTLRKYSAGASELLEHAEELLGRALSEEEDRHSFKFTMRETGLTRGKRKLLDAMRELAAAEDHLVNKYPEVAAEVRKYRKKIEAVIL